MCVETSPQRLVVQSSKAELLHRSLQPTGAMWKTWCKYNPVMAGKGRGISRCVIRSYIYIYIYRERERERRGVLCKYVRVYVRMHACMNVCMNIGFLKIHIHA